MAKFSTDDLTAGQMEALEDELGPYPWTGVGKFKVLTRVLAAITGEPVKTYQDMKLPALLDLVTLDTDAADPNA